MLLHHVVTTVLIGLSYIQGALRVGAVILVVQDLCDVVLEFAKILTALAPKRVSEAAFGVMIICWVYTRLYLFPFACLPLCFDLPDHAANIIRYYDIIRVFLVVIAVLNYFWFSLIVRVLYRKLVLQKSIEDIREKDE